MRQFVRARASLGHDCTEKLDYGQQAVLDDGKTAKRTLHQTEAVCVGQKPVFQIQKDHHIEGVVGVRSLVVKTVVIHLAALNMEMVIHVVLLQAHGRRSS